MNIERAFHEILTNTDLEADAFRLSHWIDPSNVVTGQVLDGRQTPFATVSLEDHRALIRANTSTLWRPTLRIQVFHHDHDSMIEIREGLRKLFDNQTFTTRSERMNTRLENAFALQDADGVWQLTVDIETQVEEIASCQ